MKKPRIQRLKGKGGGQEILPSRRTLSSLVAGDPAQRALGQYAKASPVQVDGSNPKEPDINQLARRGVRV